MQVLAAIMSRNPEKEVSKSWGSFDTTVRLCDHALKKKNINRYKNLLETLDSAYYKFDEEWRLYKDDMLKRVCKSQDEFNSVETVDGQSTSAYRFNDTFLNEQFERYMQIRDSLYDSLDQLTLPAGDTATPGEPSIDVELAIEEIKGDMNSLDASIVKLREEIESYAISEMPVHVAKGFDSVIEKLNKKIDTELKTKVMSKLAISKESQDPAYSNTLLRTIFGEFSQNKKTLLNECTMLLLKKVVGVKLEDRNSANGAATVTEDMESMSLSYKPREQVYLEKTKPPKFSGDELDFPEFKRKWSSQVSKAYLPEESELDKLRDAVPREAKDQLYGVVKLEKAWNILTKRYGDKLLISKKLKSQLKGIQCNGKSDPEKIINLKIKVRNIVTRLETLEMHAALTHDSEFLAAVYCALPDRHRVRWLDYDKGEDHWSAMLEFLDKAYEQANQELALLSVYKEEKKKDVKSAGVSVVGSDSSNEAKDKHKEAKKNAREICGKCVVCDQFHSWQRKDGVWWPSKKFKDMNVHQRSAAIEKCKGCPRCTSWNHTKKDCKMKPNSCGFNLGTDTCQGDHSKLVHGTTNVYCAALSASGSTVQRFSCVKENQETIFFLQDIPVRKTRSSARVMWDKGSNRVLINESYAKKFNLVSKNVTYMMEVVGSEPKQVRSKIYLLDLIDMYGNVHSIWGYGTTKIMSSSVPDLSGIRHLFPHLPEAAFAALPSKEVDILIGLNMNQLQPAGGLGDDKVGGLSTLRSLFGTGWVIGGHHEAISSPGPYEEVSPIAATLKIAKIKIEPETGLTPEFWESDGMGTLPPPRCDSCRSCMQKGACSERHHGYSVKKQAELDLIKEKTYLKEGEVFCDYPFIRDPSCLSFNRGTVIKVAEKVERDLLRDNMYEAYNEQIRDQLKSGVAVRLTEDELKSWTGPCNYITHHYVLKDSASTPVRVVSNSSFNNCGVSLNSCLAAGPNSLNPMLDVMLRYRCRPVGVQFDMAKAYNTLRTGPVERNVRRFVWRFSPADEWQDFALDRVHFGDACAATQLEVAKNLVADTGYHIDPEAALRIKEDMYVDDLLSGGTTEQVARFVGQKTENGTYNGTFAQILAIGNFRIKAISISGQKPSEESNLLGNHVLGYNYDVETDMLSIPFPLNLSRKRRSVREEANLTAADVGILKSKTLTKRILLGVVNGFGDFLGIASPFIMRYKVLMRQLFLLEEPLTWDEPIPQSNSHDWINLMMETLESGPLFFPRCVRPCDAIPGKGPVLIGCSDFGESGFDARVYLQWELQPGSDTRYAANLIMCKARVPPLKGLTVPRGELTGLTLQSRLMVTVVRALQKLEDPPVSAVMLVDSKCALSSVYSVKLLLPFFQNRVSEVRENMSYFRKLCPMEEIQYVESALNPSDISTRATATISQLGPGSLHQTGPEFFRLPREEWPVSQSYSAADIPSCEYKIRDKLVFSAAVRFNFVKSGLYPANPWTVVEELLHYSNSIDKIKRILARYLRGLGSILRKSGKLVMENPTAYDLIASEPTRDELWKAERLLLLHGMPQTKEALDNGKLDSLLPVYEGKLIVTRGRLGESSLEKLLGVKSLPILMPESRIAHLYMVQAHCGEFGLVHRGAVATLARSRNKVWITKGRNLARKVSNNCPICIKNRKQLLVQQMSEIREESTTVAPPWQHLALDFAGPITVKGEVNRRAKLKSWILVYTCRATKAVCLLATSGYSTADFLCKHEEMVFRKGRPESVVSDRGSQLVAAGVTIANKDLPINKLDWKQVTAVNCATNWTFVPIGGQHRNGLSEASVKVLKKSLSLAIHPSVELTYAELVTLLARISHSINSRPLSIRNVSSNSQQEDILLPLTPNHLLLGRASIDIPDLDYDTDNRFSARLAYVQQVFQSWWDRWIRDILPTLVPCKRWKDAKKNISEGDVVMMKYEGNMKDDYRLAIVKKTFKDKKGLVRTVKVGFRKRDKREPPNVYWKKTLTEEIVPIQRLALLQSVNEPLPTGGLEDQLPLDAVKRLDLVKAALMIVK